MSRTLKRKNSTRQKMSRRLVLAVALFSSGVLITGGWLVYLNMLDWESSRAAGNGNASGGSGYAGEVLCEYAWEQEPGKATVGPDAVTLSKSSCIIAGGRASTRGLSAGSKAQDINMVLPSLPLFEVDGIDISVDFKKIEPTASLFCRGKSLEFWIDRGYPAVLYRTYDVNGGYAMVNERSAYEIPDDGVFRTYRFIYTPVTGRGELFVNGVIIWSHQGTPNTALYWKDAGRILVGKGMNGNGRNEAILDNLVIRSTGSIVPLAESLINFMLETRSNGIHVQWAVSESSKAKSFIIEKSVNAVDFVKIAEVEASAEDDHTEYEYFDKTSQTSGTFYYRLKQILKSGKFVNHQPSAIRTNSKKDLCIDNLNLSAASATLDVACFIPESGKVRIQLTDASGKLIRTENFSASAGNNVYVIKNMESLDNGTYTVNVICNEKRVSRKLVKG